MNNSVFFHMLIIFGSLVLLILLAIFIPLIFMIRKTNQQRRDREWLQEHGTRITASVKYVILQGGDSEPRSDQVQGVGLLIDALGDASPRQIAYDERQLSRPGSSSTRRYQITAQWVYPRTGEPYIFQQTVSSTTLPKGYDPLSLSEVTVLIEPGNPKRYYIELPSSP